MSTARSEAVTKSRQRALAEGRRRLTTLLSAEGSATYDRLKERFGSERELIEAALSALERRNELTREELLSELARRLK